MKRENGNRCIRLVRAVVLLMCVSLCGTKVMAEGVDYASYADELRHKEPALILASNKNVPDVKSSEGSGTQNKDLAGVGKERSEVSKNTGELLFKDDAEDLLKETDNVEDLSALKNKSGEKYVKSTAKDEVRAVKEVKKETADEWMVKPGDEKRNSQSDKLARQLKIDQVLKASKAIAVPSSTGDEVIAPPQKIYDSQTEAQIIEDLLKPEFLATKVDLEFTEASLGDVFLTLGKSGNINVMLDPMIKDLNIDISLKQVGLKEAYMLLAASYNLAFKRIENSLFVTTREKVLQQSVAYKVIKLRNVKALEVKAMVTDLVRTVNVSEQMNSLIVIGQPEDIAKVEGVVKAVDHAQPQVILEANIVEVNKDALKDLGIDWSDEVALSFQEGGRPVTLPNVANPSDSLLEIGSFERNPISFTAAIKMLENQNKAKVLSNPRVTTMNEKEAEIFVGDRIPYTVNTSDGGLTTTEVRFEEPGIRLKITPMIIDGDFVVVKVEPEVSFIFSFRGADNQFPWVKKRHATAFVRIRNNQPFVLGGLLNQEDKKSLFKVPLLGNVPWLGNLFTYEKHTVTDTELIITITPTVVPGS